MNDEDKTHEDWMKEAQEEADHICESHGSGVEEIIAIFIGLFIALLVTGVIGAFVE